MAIDKQTQQDIINYLVSQGYTDEMIKEVIASYDDTPPQAPSPSATQLDRVVAVVDKVNTKVDGKASADTIRFVSEGTPAVNHPISEALGTTDGNTIASMKFVRDEVKLLKVWDDATGAQVDLSAMDGSNASKTLAPQHMVNARARNNFNNVNVGADKAGAIIAIKSDGTLDYVSKQLVVVFNDGSAKSFKVG